MARVLVIDGEESVRMLVSQAAIGMGCEVVEATNGDDGLQKFQKSLLFDLVITNIVMPNVDGLEVIASLRQHSADVKIIAYSASDPDTGKERLELSKQRGATLTLNAPFTKREIQRAIREALEN